MLIIIIELISIFLLISFLTKKGYDKLKKYIFFAFIIQFFILIIYRLELSYIGREVYYSDAEMYWNATLDLLDGRVMFAYNMGYIYYSYLIQLTSPFIWAGFINISNLLLIDFIILFLTYLLIENGVCKKNIYFFVILTATNPLIVYSLIRNLKDVLFLFYATAIFLLFYRISKGNKLYKKIINYFMLLLVTILITGIRPWGFLISIVIFSYLYLKQLFSDFKYRPIHFIIKIISGVIIFAIVLYGMFKLGYIDTLNMWIPIVLKNALQTNITSLILAPFKILIGPGPIRPMFGNIYFIHYTICGNIFSSIGALLWWFVLGILIANLMVNKKYKFKIISKMFFIMFALFIGIYSLQYGGSLELRFRGIIYILTSSLILSLVEFKINKKILSYSLLNIFIIFIGGILFGV